MSPVSRLRTFILSWLPPGLLERVAATLTMIGLDGAATLLLANLFILTTGGTALIWWFYEVYRVGRDTPSGTSHPGCRLILGERLYHGSPSANFEQRLARGMALRGSGPILIVGGPAGANVTEARAGRDWLVARGVSSTEIELEESSRNTLENLAAIREYMRNKPDELAIIITSRYHAARCGIMAAGVGLRYVICAGDDIFKIDLNNLRNMLVEAYFLNWYSVGRIWATVTNNRKMLGRIS